MKKIITRIVILLVMTMAFTACHDDNSLTTPPKETGVKKYKIPDSAIAQLNTFFGTHIKAHVVDITKGKNKTISHFFSTLKSTSLSINKWDINNSATLTFVTDKGDTLVSGAIPLLSNPNIMTCFVKNQGETKAYVLKFSFDEINETLSYQIISDINPLNLKKINSWMSCMKGVMASEVGVVITVSGVAAGLGCVPCAGVAGFYTGFAALGCIVG
jgi:hypothetical protein